MVGRIPKEYTNAKNVGLVYKKARKTTNDVPTDTTTKVTIAHIASHREQLLIMDHIKHPIGAIHVAHILNEYNNGNCPYCGTRLQGQPEDTYPWWRFSGHQTTIIPICKHCGHRVRRGITSDSRVSYIQDDHKKITPWNYRWNGKCEYCGHDYSFDMETLLDIQGQKKRTTVSADSRVNLVNRNDHIYTVLSGVTIRTFVGETMRGEIFLSANELKYLLDSLEDSPLLEQCDYKFDSM